MPSGGGVEIQVRNTGCGISKQDIPLIFEPFFTTKTKGKGVGPSTVFGIIDRHKGTIHVESGLGKGAAFTVKLPVETKLSKSEATRSPSHSSFQDRRTQIPSPERNRNMPCRLALDPLSWLNRKEKRGRRASSSDSGFRRRCIEAHRRNWSKAVRSCFHNPGRGSHKEA
jgi:hypothetical protein